jgi:hypothetical protein
VLEYIFAGRGIGEGDCTGLGHGSRFLIGEARGQPWSNITEISLFLEIFLGIFGNYAQ